MTLSAKTLGEELVGAEIVAGKELTEVAGGLFDVVETAGSIWLQQGLWFVEDYSRFWLETLGPAGDPAGLRRLWEARAGHLASGLQQAGELARRECTPLAGVWASYFGTVLKDWRGA